jgi:hypothetical protein
MTDPLQLIRQTQAENRLQYADKQERQQRIDQQRSKSYTYQGYNAETGQPIINNGNDSVNVNAVNTNGLIKPNQPVKYLQSGNQSSIDAKPRPKRTEDQTTSSVSGKIKVLFTIAESDTLSVYVGGWKTSPVKLATYQNQGISSPVLNNLGGDRFIASWLLVGADGTPIDVIVKTNSGGWTLKQLYPDANVNALRDPGNFSELGRNLGFGMWISAIDNPTTGPLSDTRGTGQRGYWYDEQLQTADYSNRFQQLGLNAEQEHANDDEYTLTGQTYVLPNRAEEWSEYAKHDGKNYTETRQRSEVFLVNSTLTQSFGYRNHYVYQLGSDGTQARSGITVFGSSDRLLVAGSKFTSRDFLGLYSDVEGIHSLQPFNTNWIGEKLYRVPVFVDGTGETGNFLFDQPSKFTKTQHLVIEELEFGSDGPIGVKQARTFKADLFPLRASLDPAKTSLYSISYHPN